MKGGNGRRWGDRGTSCTSAPGCWLRVASCAVSFCRYWIVFSWLATSVSIFSTCACPPRTKPRRVSDTRATQHPSSILVCKGLFLSSEKQGETRSSHATHQPRRARSLRSQSLASSPGGPPSKASVGGGSKTQVQAGKLEGGGVCAANPKLELRPRTPSPSHSCGCSYTPGAPARFASFAALFDNGMCWKQQWLLLLQQFLCG